MGSIRLCAIITALIDLAALIAFAVFLLRGNVADALLVAIFGAAVHALYSPTVEERAALAKFLIESKKS